MTLSNLTIIIPTHSRHRYLDRVLSYYSGKKLRVLVADSSTKPYENKMPDNAIYLHYKRIEYFEKMLNVLNYVKTDYAVICADDDFISVNALANCVKFLDKNPDYISVQGRSVSFKIDSKNSRLIPIYLVGRDLNIHSNEIEERLMGLFSQYIPVYYSTFKTEALQQCLTFTNKQLIKNANLFEICMAFLTIILGKHKVLPVFYSAREDGDSAGGLNRKPVEELIVNNDPEFRKMCNALSNFIGEIENEDKDNAEEKLEIAIKKFMFQSRKKLRYRNLVSIIPESIKLIFKRMAWDNYLIRKVRNEKGYPFYDNEAIQEWKKMEKIIKYYL